MFAARAYSLRKRAFLLMPVLAAVALLHASQAVASLPAGTNVLTVNGQVTITSRLGTETIQLTGTATVSNGPSYVQGGLDVVDTEITAMNLTGNSLTGPVSVIESPTLASTGKLESLQASPDTLPATSYFDVFVQATIPASPGGSATLHNDTALRMLPSPNNRITSWPPQGTTYTATPNPCVALMPALPAGICITEASFTIPVTVGGIAQLTGVDSSSLARPRDSRTNAAEPIGIAGGAVAIVVALGAAAWGLRRSR